MSFVRALCLSLLLLATAVPSLVVANDNPDTLRVLHRIYHPSRPSEPFSDRGVFVLVRSGAASTLHTKDTRNAVHGAHLVAYETLLENLPSLEEAFQNVVDDLASNGMSTTEASQEVLYQLALEHPGDTHHSQWHVSSVKACHLAQSTYEDLILHLSTNTSLPPFALDYFVGPIPHDGSCPPLPTHKPKSDPTGDDQASAEANSETPLVSFANLARLNSTVHVKAPRVPPLPTLKTPPPVNAEGNVVQPIPEKSFLQKYWIYIAVGLAALALAPGPPEEEGQGGGQKR